MKEKFFAWRKKCGQMIIKVKEGKIRLCHQFCMKNSGIDNSKELVRFNLLKKNLLKAPLWHCREKCSVPLL